jgi:hypothetical protein
MFTRSNPQEAYSASHQIKMQTVARTQRAFGAPSSLIKPKISTSVSRAVVVKAKQQHDAALSSRREILAGSTLAAVMPAFLAQLPAKADSGGLPGAS